MMSADLQALIQHIFPIPSCSMQEDWLRTEIERVAAPHADHIFGDGAGNLYLRKGRAEHYPLLVAHLDSVHREHLYFIRERQFILLDTSPDRISGRHPLTNCPVGLGVDDKAGIVIALAALMRLPVLKIFLPVMEEVGMKGTAHALLHQPSFFADVGYILSLDSPGQRDVTHVCNGIELFSEQSEFWKTTQSLLDRHLIPGWELVTHPFTDVCLLAEEFGVASINLPVGYENFHSSDDFVSPVQMERTHRLVLDMAVSLGNARYN